MADVGNEIQKYSQEIASASVASNKKTAEWADNVSKESKTKDAQLLAMMAQIQALTDTVASLSTVIMVAFKENIDPSNDSSGGGIGGVGGGGGGDGGGCDCWWFGRNRDFYYTHNMGYYARHTTITQSASTTQAWHAPKNATTTRTAQPPQIAWAAVRSGQD